MRPCREAIPRKESYPDDVSDARYYWDDDVACVESTHM
jgi:hypothetical protein